MALSTHRVNVVRIKEIKTHPNADTLGIVEVGGYQCVVKLDSYRVGDLAIYIQPDSVVPATPQFSFLWDGKPMLTIDEGDKQTTYVPEKYRRITVRRFRKEWSEGLLVPILDFPGVLFDKCGPCVEEGDDVAAQLGITHYDPEEQTGAPATPKPFRWPRTFHGWAGLLLHVFSFGYIDQSGRKKVPPYRGPAGGRPEYDVEAFKNYKGTFCYPSEQVVATEKIHGSNARYTFQDGQMYAGSHYTWKRPDSTCVYRKALAQHPWIEEWCRAHEGYTLYGEVVPTQKGFDYGCKEGEVNLYVFDILTPDGKWVDFPEVTGAFTHGLQWVPVLFMGPVSELMDKLPSVVDGMSTVGKHIREGIVVRPFIEREARGLGRVLLKIVSNKYLEKAA